MKRKICVVITARPSYSRIKSALKAIQAQPNLELQLVIAASALLNRYGEVVKVIEQDGFNITEKVYMVLDGEKLVTSAKSTGLGIIELATTFDNLKPDIVVTIADRYETISTAIAASYMNIPLAHVQGGEVTGSIDEKVRHSITKLSDLHFVATKKAAERVVKMGEDPQNVYVTGCPSIDLASEVLRNGNYVNDPIAKYRGVGDVKMLPKDYIVVLQHPVTTEHELARKHVDLTLWAIKDLGITTLWFWPNVDAGSDGTSRGIRAFRENEKPRNIQFFKNVEPEEFLKIISKAGCIVGNSSVAIRECSFLGVPAVNIGGRQAGRERGRNVLDVDHEYKMIMDAIKKQINNGHYPQDTLYGDGHAGERIGKLLASVPLSIEKRLTY
jgi:UDP-hydrolysing UDP-N-acetyl-D-glucosamine 2-epimerase